MVKVEGNGPIGAIIADGNAKGHVRGYVLHPHVHFDLNEKGKLDVARAVGTEGRISVIKDLGLGTILPEKRQSYPVRSVKILPIILPPRNRFLRPSGLGY